MDKEQFDKLTRTLEQKGPRRAFGAFILGLALTGGRTVAASPVAQAPVVEAPTASASKRRKAKKGKGGGQEKVCVCHKAGPNKRFVLCPAEPGAVNGHLGHGDCLCSDPGCNCAALKHKAACSVDLCAGVTCKCGTCDPKTGKCPDCPVCPPPTGYGQVCSETCPCPVVDHPTKKYQCLAGYCDACVKEGGTVESGTNWDHCCDGLVKDAYGVCRAQAYAAA